MRHRKSRSQSLLRDIAVLAAGLPSSRRHQSRRRPSRLTLSVAGLTTASVLGVSAGVAVAATSGPAHGFGGHGTARPAATAAARTAGQPRARSGLKAAAPAAAPAPAGQQHPYLVYDSVIPDAIPAGHVVATYATGPQAVPASAVAGDKAVLWIDVNGTDPAAGAVDVEPGDVTPDVVPGWVQARLTADPQGVAIIYTMLSEWPQVQAAVATLPSWMQARVRWWIADPTGYPHVVPGASATQWYWGPAYDISTALPGF